MLSLRQWDIRELNFDQPHSTQTCVVSIITHFYSLAWTDIDVNGGDGD